MECLVGVLPADFDKRYRCPVRVVVAVINICVEVVLKLCVHSQECVRPLINKVEVILLCTAFQDPRKDCVELVWLDVCVIADAVKDLQLIIQEVVRLSCVLLLTVPHLSEDTNCLRIQFLVAELDWGNCLVRVCVT